jgi:membrane fusion protein
MEVVPIRAEVIEARRSRSAGPIVLARPVPVRLAAWCSGAVLVALGLLLGCAEYTRKVRVAGKLEPTAGAIKVVAPQFGRITARKVRAGDTVKAGQVLFELSGERIGSAGSVDDRIGASLAARRRELEQRRELTLQQLGARGAALADQQRMAEGEITTHRSAMLIEDELVDSARANVQRYEKLAKNGFVAPAQLAQMRNALNVELAKRSALKLNLGNAVRTLSQLRQEAASNASSLKLARSESRQALAALEQETAEHDGRRAMRVTAPAAGIATAMGFEPGQTVPAGTPLATILPAGSVMEAQLNVPSRARAFVKPGQQVLLRIAAFPYQKFGLVPGTVARVDRSPISDGAQAGGDQLYRVTVALAQQSVESYGEAIPIEAGMALEADILQDRRRLIEWVFDPLVSAAKGRTR